jgi:excisionase family DNA binding protein
MAVDQDELITVPEAAKILRLSVPTIKRWLKDGRIPAYRLGPRAIRIRRADLTRLLTPLHNEASSAHEHPLGAPSPIQSQPPIRRLTDEEVAQAREAMKAAQQHREEMRARRGGKPLSSSWEILRELREERSKR